MVTDQGPYPAQYPVQFAVEYPDRPLNRLTSGLRIFVIIPIWIVLGTVSGASWGWAGTQSRAYAAGAGGLLFLGPLLMNDSYPSTDEHQWVRLDYPYPDAANDLNRWLPLVKWLLAIPHYIVLFFLDIAVFFVVIVAWFAILFTERYPRGMFDFVEGVFRWHNRVAAYALTLVTD